ncbi:MAG: hypothetical protein KFH98_00050 [Gemmatimonadetes bacterium]|nr:hypothetical protein [Gemmatimonadota bacterium]
MTYRMKQGAFALVLALVVPGCAGNALESLGDILGGAAGMPGSGGQQGQIEAEIRQVNTQQRTIQVATADGRTGNVSYDQNTVVVYRQQQYAVTALERGDLAVLHVQETSQGGLYTNRIDVQTSAQDRTGQSGSILQYSGRVSQIDQQRGLFVLQMQNGSVTVSVPYNAPRATVDYFQRLRVGDDVRLEATAVSTGNVQIHRFL